MDSKKPCPGPPYDTQDLSKPVTDVSGTAHSMTITAPGTLPLVGHTLRLLRAPLEFFQSLPAHGDVVNLRLGPMTATLVCDPDLTRQVLLDDRTFDKGGFFYDRARQVAGNGLATCAHAQHRRQRRLIQPAFHPARMPGYASVMTDQAATVIGTWQDGQIIDVLDQTARITSQVAVATMFPATPPALLSTMREDLTSFVSGIYRLMFLPWTASRRFNRTVTRLRQSIRTIIAHHQLDDSTRDDLLSTLLTPPEQGEQRPSDSEVIDQVAIFFVAGYETTANALAWALHLLAQHRDVQQRLHAEVDHVLTGATPTVEDLPKLPVVTSVVAETLRLYPPGWIFTRVATVDTQLGAHTIPAGRTIVYSPYVLHRRSDLYPDPERFDPDRWTTTPRRGAFLPFGAGPRRCIGEKFGTIEAALVLAVVATRWDLQPVAGHRVRPGVGVALRPRRLRLRTVSRARAGTPPRSTASGTS